MSEKRIALGAGVNVLWTTSDSNFGALWAEALLATRLSTYVPSVVALNVGCAVLASVSRAPPAGGMAPFGPETIDQAYVSAYRLLLADRRVAPCRTTRSGPGSAIGRPGRSTLPLASRAANPWPTRKSASTASP